ncbi:hypothetical protein [Edaphobacter acidisoli]|uniref:hypothetical protein n=1 Tax=Edaphobacter acidisoli TaxID=2040573 RepID=UPI00166749CF|nr:hypothetical protein [Edaphobacter acidisoli]
MNRRSALRYAVGAMLCWLLVVYAVGAKLALYHIHQPGAKSVASTKAWQDHDINVVSADVQIAPAVTVLPQVSVGALLLAMAFATVWVLPVERNAPTMVLGFSPELSVRPPPAV